MVKKSAIRKSLEKSASKISSSNRVHHQRNFGLGGSIAGVDNVGGPTLRLSQKDVSLRLCADGSVEVSKDGEDKTNIVSTSAVFMSKAGASFVREDTGKLTLQGRLLDIKEQLNSQIDGGQK